MVLPPDFACSASVSLSLWQRKLKQFSLGLKVSFVFVLQPSSGWIFRAVLAVEQLVSLGRLLKGSMHVRCMQFFVQCNYVVLCVKFMGIITKLWTHHMP